MVRGAGVIFFAYIGFDAVSTAAQEAKNPQRDMPIGMLVSLGICTVLYIVVSLVLTGMVNYTQLNDPAPIAVAINALGPKLAWLRVVVKIGAIAGLSSVILVMLLGQPRIFYTMSKDGLLPPVFSAVHPKFRTPWIAQILTGAIAMLIAGLFPIGLLGELVSIGTLLAFAIVCAGVFVLRFTDPADSPAVSHAGILAGRAAGRDFLRLPDVWPAARHLGAAHRLDGHRPGHLLRLQPPPFQIAAADTTRRRELKFGFPPPPALSPTRKRQPSGAFLPTHNRVQFRKLHK